MNSTTAESFIEIATRDDGTDGKIYKDATIGGALDRALLDRPMEIGAAYSKKDSSWRSLKGTFAEFLARLCTFERGEKDGRAFLQGSLKASGPRKAQHMAANHWLMFDCDSGYALEQILEALPDDLFCVVYTTHSHLKTQTTLKKKALQAHRKREGRTGEATADDARDYLLNVKKCNPVLLERATYAFDATGACLVTHQPWPRMRLLLVLAKPFTFASEADRELWRRKYLAVADKFGLVVDESCLDPSRLFYLPRIAEGGVIEEGAHEILIFAGQPFDLESVETPPQPEPRKKDRQPGSTPSGGSAVQSGEFLTPHMRRFLEIGGSSFAAADWLASIAPQDIRHMYDGERAGQIDATCPLTGGHADDNRCFHVRNSKPNDEFAIWCLHADCAALAAKPNGSQDRGKYLDALCQKHGIASASELLEFCDDEAQDSWAPDRTAAYEEIDDEPAGTEQPTEPDMTMIDIIRAPAPLVPLDCFGSMGKWLELAAQAKSCPVDYPMINLLAAVAGAIGTKRVAIVGDWREPSIVWTGAVGESSDGKSPGADAVMGPLREAEKSMASGYAPALALYEADKRVAVVALEKWEQAVDDAAVQGLPPPAKPSEALEPAKPKRLQLIISDTTTESVAQLLSENQHGLIQVSDELKVWMDFDRYSGKGSNRAFWVQAFGGRPYRLNRKSNPEPIDIPRNAVTVAGNLVTESLAELLDINDGLFARFLLAWPESAPLVRSGPVSDGPRLVRVLRKLLALSWQADAEAVALPLTAEAADAFHEWRIKNRADCAETDGFHKSALGKHPGYVLRLALVLKHLWWADSTDQLPPISLGLPELKAAMRLLDTYFAPMLKRVLGEKSNNSLARATRCLARAIRAKKAKRVNVTEIMRKWHVTALDNNLVVPACHCLVDAGWLLPIKAQPNNAGGQPGKNWNVDPRVHEWQTLGR